MSLSSGILFKKGWKFAGDFLCQRFGRKDSCPKLECVASTCSKLLERASRAGFPVGKQEAIGPAGNPSDSQMEERLLLYLEYHPQGCWYGCGYIIDKFALTYKIATPLPVPFAINYLFEGNAHVYLPDVIGQLKDGSLVIAEAGQKPRQTPGAQSNQSRGGTQSCRAARGRLLDWHGDHLIQNETRQSGLFTCPTPTLSSLAGAFSCVAGQLACW